MKLLINRSHTSLRSSHVSQILSFCKLGALFESLKLLNTINSAEISSDVKPLVYASLLQTATKIKCFNHGLQLHCYITKSGLIANSLVGNSLLSLYFKLGGNLNLATKLFNELRTKDVISWTSMISGYVRVKPRKAIKYFWAMLDDGIEANAFTLSAGIKACSEIRYVRLGRCFHGVVFRGGFELNDVIASALMDMYGKNGCLKYARNVFDKLSVPDPVCWSSIISALIKNDLYEEGLAYFYVMQREHKVVPDEFTYGSILTACGNLERLKQGKEVHARVITAGLCGNVVAESSLVDMYGKCGQMGDSQRVFDRMRKRNAVSWCALLNGYCQNGLFESVVKLFRMMEDPDLYSFGTLIRACAGLAAVRQGREVHCQYIRKGRMGHVIVESALVDLYAKCGCIDYAQRLFMQMPTRNLISWNSMICGFAQNGRGLKAIELFNKMVKEGVRPDYISFLGVIFACSHAGLVEQGRGYFFSMTEVYGIKPGTEHCNCMVDLLGRAGLINEAENLIEKAECKDSFSLWPALLGACTTNRNSAAVERIALKMMELEPKNHLSYVHLINVYKCDGRWNDALKIRKLMDDRRAEKLPGKSWVENAFGLVQIADSNMESVLR
ncbi:pentatricopeptide repeat-containing protein At1g03540-like [Chenopodium quinoa]|uniref:pentatricopeptide repeat-containing protein At1g03540-like n=1 Tax=Chenopodium quinoa TaxID=63459 RepID=UPI000B784E95|nr:pentatricopeptide repeat-containing protein At1g03540-like [Chenopodium quinoa]